MEEEEYYEKSRSQKKREVTKLQKLGESLMELSDDQIKAIDVEKELIDAVLLAKTMKRGNAKKRQLQYIGVLMRKIDHEPIEKALMMLENGISITGKKFSQVEKWRDGLLDGTIEVEFVIEEMPSIDRQKIRQLIRNCEKEKKAGKPLKSSKKLYQYLKEMSNKE